MKRTWVLKSDLSRRPSSVVFPVDSEGTSTSGQASVSLPKKNYEMPLTLVLENVYVDSFWKYITNWLGQLYKVLSFFL